MLLKSSILFSFVLYELLYLPKQMCSKIFYHFVGRCRRIKFIPPENSQYFKDHVFSNLSIGSYTSCEEKCVMERECVSVNIGPPVNDRVVCELSNSDHWQHPEDLIPTDRAGHTRRRGISL